jgi:Saxitoxin biosynthesis operon protein SxtJ
MIPINKNPSPREIRTFARIWFPLFVAAMGAALWWRLPSPVPAIVVWLAGGALAGLVLSSAEAARIVFVGLMTVTYPIGLVVSTIALGIMFYLVFTPLGLLMRLAGRDALRLRAREDRSHWVPYEQDDDPERAFRQY